MTNKTYSTQPDPQTRLSVKDALQVIEDAFTEWSLSDDEAEMLELYRNLEHYAQAHLIALAKNKEKLEAVSIGESV